jgi:hypothetical protein
VAKEAYEGETTVSLPWTKAEHERCAGRLAINARRKDTVALFEQTRTRGKSRFRVLPEELDRIDAVIREEWPKGVKIASIAEMVGRSPPVVGKRIRELGLQR